MSVTHADSRALAAALAAVTVLCCLFLVTPTARAESGKPLRVAIEGEYPPFSYLDADGRLAGFDVDIALALCRAMDRPCELVKTPWAGIIDHLEQGQFDCVVASMSYTPERAKRVDFTKKYYRTTSSYIARTDADFDPSPEGVRGRRLATQAETVHAKYLAETYGKDIDLALTDTLERSFELLTDGKVDAVLCNSLTGYQFLASEPGKAFDYFGEPLSEKNLSSTANIAVRKGDAALREALDAALATIHETGEYDRVNKKYFPFSIY